MSRNPRGRLELKPGQRIAARDPAEIGASLPERWLGPSRLKRHAERLVPGTVFIAMNAMRLMHSNAPSVAMDAPLLERTFGGPQDPSAVVQRGAVLVYMGHVRKNLQQRSKDRITAVPVHVFLAPCGRVSIVDPDSIEPLVPSAVPPDLTA